MTGGDLFTKPLPTPPPSECFFDPEVIGAWPGCLTRGTFEDELAEGFDDNSNSGYTQSSSSESLLVSQERFCDGCGFVVESAQVCSFCGSCLSPSLCEATLTGNSNVLALAVADICRIPRGHASAKFGTHV